MALLDIFGILEMCPVIPNNADRAKTRGLEVAKNGQNPIGFSENPRQNPNSYPSPTPNSYLKSYGLDRI